MSYLTECISYIAQISSICINVFFLLYHQFKIVLFFFLNRFTIYLMSLLIIFLNFINLFIPSFRTWAQYKTTTAFSWWLACLWSWTLIWDRSFLLVISTTPLPPFRATPNSELEFWWGKRGEKWGRESPSAGSLYFWLLKSITSHCTLSKLTNQLNDK